MDVDSVAHLRYHLEMHAALNSSKDMTWQTPDSLLELVRKVGAIALDPCTVVDNPTQARRIFAADAVPFPSADSIFGVQYAFSVLGVDGLAHVWGPYARGHGLVYVNPPYGRELGKWMAKCSAEGAKGAEIIALTPARPGTAWFQTAADVPDGPTVLFWRGRLKFKGAPASAPFPSALWYWGKQHQKFRDVFAGRGLFL